MPATELGGLLTHRWLTTYFACGLIALAAPGFSFGESPSTDSAKSDWNANTVERLIYMPYKNLQEVFEKQDGSILVPYVDYLKLVERAIGTAAKRNDRPPVGGVITSATYFARIEKDFAKITANLVVQVLDKGWVEVPVTFGKATIGQLTSDSQNVLLRRTDSEQKGYALLFSTPGEHKVSFELTARVETTPQERLLQFHIPSVAITTFELLVPEADQTIVLNPQLIAEPIATTGEAPQTRIKASVGATEKIVASWYPRVSLKPEMNRLANVTNETRVSVDEGLIHTDTWLTYEVLRGQLDSLRIVVPRDHRILDITADAKVKEWNAVDEANRQVVTVDLVKRVERKLTLEIHTEMTAPVGAFDVAGQEATTAFGIHALDVIRESGTIAVKQTPDLTLTVAEQQGLSRIDAEDVDAKLKRPGSLYYKFYRPEFRLQLIAKPVAPRIIVDQFSQLIFQEDQLQLRSICTMTIDRSGLFELVFRLPENLRIENVACDKMKQFDVSPDKSMLTISLQEKTIGNIAMTLFATRPIEPAAQKTDQLLPLLEPIGVNIETGRVQVYAPEFLDVLTDTETLIAAQPDPTPVGEAVAGSRLVSSWVYNRRPVEIPVRTVRKPTRLTALIGTRATVLQGLIQVTTDLTYLMEYAGIDTFRFSVPEALADKVQIHSTAGGSAPPIKQKSRAVAAVDGWVTWTVVMQRDVLGSQPFQITYDLIPTIDADTQSEKSILEAIRVHEPYDKSHVSPGIRPLEISRTIGELTVVKDRALSVSTVASGGDVESIDVRELRHLSQDGFVAFRYFKQPITLELSSNKYDIQGVVETVVSKALVEIVLDRAGTATFRARYAVKSSERQRLRVDLPSGVEPLAVLLDRKPVTLEKAGGESKKGWDPYFVNVARTKPSDEEFSLVFLFRNPLSPAPFESYGGKLLLRLPVVGGSPRSAVTVQQLRIAVWVPEQYALIGTPNSFRVERRTSLGKLLFSRHQNASETHDLDRWIGADSGGVVDFPTEGRRYQYANLGGRDTVSLGWWHLPFYTWIISGSLVLIALVLRGTSWDNKLTILILAAFAAATYALTDADLIVHGLAVAAYGLAALLAIWLIHCLLSQKRISGAAITPNPLTDPQHQETSLAIASPPQTSDDAQADNTEPNKN